MEKQNTKLKNKIAKNVERHKKITIKNGVKGITLIALVITIIVLLILARSKYCNTYWK